MRWPRATRRRKATDEEEEERRTRIPKTTRPLIPTRERSHDAGARDERGAGARAAAALVPTLLCRLFRVASMACAVGPY